MWGVPRLTRIAVALACSVAIASCSSDDSPETSDDVVVVASNPDADSDVDDGAATSATIDGPSSEEPDVELLAAVLVTPAAVGVPDTWAIRDLDPAVPAEQLASDDLDLAFGVVGCPLGPPATGDGGPWLRRRFAAPDVPLDNRLLAIEIVAEVQEDGAFASRLDAIEACVDGGDDALVGVETQRRSEADVEGIVLTVGAAPSTDVTAGVGSSIAVAYELGDVGVVDAGLILTPASPPAP